MEKLVLFVIAKLYILAEYRNDFGWSGVRDFQGLFGGGGYVGTLPSVGFMD